MRATLFMTPKNDPDELVALEEHVTQIETHLPPMPAAYAKGEHVWMQTLHINLAYMAVQIVVAGVCITLLCFAGIDTNETVDMRVLTVTDTCRPDA